MSDGNQTKRLRIVSCARGAVGTWLAYAEFKQTWISTPNFLAIGLIDSYRITGFFFKLNSTAVIPCTARSRAFESQVVAEEPYKGRSIVGACPREKRDGRIGV